MRPGACPTNTGFNMKEDGRKIGEAHGDFLLCNHYGSIFASYRDCCMSRTRDSFEGIFYRIHLSVVSV